MLFYGMRNLEQPAMIIVTSCFVLVVEDIIVQLAFNGSSVWGTCFVLVFDAGKGTLELFFSFD